MSAPSDQTGTTTPSSTLSAEAAEFVPGRFTPSNSNEGGQQGGVAGGGAKGVSEVPRYLTTCFPFVNMGGAPQGVKVIEHPAGSRTFVPPNAAAFTAGLQQHACPHMGAFHQQVGFQPGPHPHPHPHTHRWLPPHALTPGGPFPPTLSMAPLTPGIHIPFDGGTSTPSSNLMVAGSGGLHPSGPKGMGLLTRPSFPGVNRQQVLTPTMMMSYPRNQMFVGSEQTVAAGASGVGVRSVGGQVGLGVGVNVSRGTQKATSSLPSAIRTHTLIMKDNSVQTDFHKDIADCTLQEKPNILYRRGQRKNKGNQPIASTDSEEVDSDSGYSSPLHRRNLVSNGTHPVRIGSMQDERDTSKTSGGKSAVLETIFGSGASSQDVKRTETVLTVSETSAFTKTGQRSSSVVVSGVSSSSPTVKGSVEVRDKEPAGVSSSIGQSDTRATPAVCEKDPSVPATQPSGQAAASKDRCRTPVTVKDAGKSDSDSIRGIESGVKPLPSNKTSTISQPPSTSTPSSKEPPKQPRSPASLRRTPTPSLPDFPTLKPAKRNEPPWSLTPNLNKNKKGDGGGFMGMVADSVKSYASIVKSLSSPSAAPSPTPSVELQLSQEADTPVSNVSNSGVSSLSSQASGTDASIRSSSSQQNVSNIPSLLSLNVGPANNFPSLGSGNVRKSNRSLPQQSVKSIPPQSSGNVGNVCTQSQQTGSVGGAWAQGQSERVDHSQIPAPGQGWIQLEPETSGAVDLGSPGSGWILLPPQNSDVPPLDLDKEGWIRLEPEEDLCKNSAAHSDREQMDSPRAGSVYSLSGGDSPRPGSVHSPRGGAGSKVLRSSSLPNSPRASASVVKKAGPVWVGQAGTVLKGGAAQTKTDSGPIVSPAPSSGTDNSKQLCDTKTNQLSSVTERRSSTDNPCPSQNPLTDGVPPLNLPADPQDGNVTDSTHPQSVMSGDEEEEPRRRPRKRKRRRKRKTKVVEVEGLSDGMSGMERTVSSSNISRTSEVTLHFEDEEEFPEIGAASGNEGPQSVISGQEERSPVREPLRVTHAIPPLMSLPFRKPDPLHWISYSDVLRKPSVNDVRSRTQSAPGSCLSGEEGGDENFNSQPGQGSSGQASLSKRARKRKKRRELANRAADAELAEISLELQMLRQKVVTSRGSRQSSGSRQDKSPARGLITDQSVVRQARGEGGGSGGEETVDRLHQPMQLSLADMLAAFEKKKIVDPKTASLLGGGKSRDKKTAGNILDSNAPTKRGKERETPKPKKHSPLKKVILKEREEKKRMRMIGDCDMDVYSNVDLHDDPETDSELDDPERGLGESVTDEPGNPAALAESDLSQDGLSSRSIDTDLGVSPCADLSPISQTSPLSMSPLTPGASPLSSPIAGYLSRDPVVLRIHSRRFREYCTQILDKDIDTACTALLHELVRFQDRMYHKDPNKAKGKRRVVLGLREVTKHLRLNKIKCVIISPNMEKIQSKGGLDEALNNILNMCQEQQVPFVFALGRRALGRACAKLVPVSVAGIFNYEGCEEKFNELISLTHKGREAYEDMVKAVEKEIADNPPPPTLSANCSLPSLYAHMGHSRTPSGCSAISFTSSVLSEPISENYPHAEPETDSKGYEIVRSADGKVVPRAPAHQNGGHQPGYQPPVDDSDDGNEADTEDASEGPRRRKMAGKKSEEAKGKGGESGDGGQLHSLANNRVGNHTMANHQVDYHSAVNHNLENCDAVNHSVVENSGVENCALDNTAVENHPAESLGLENGCSENGGSEILGSENHGLPNDRVANHIASTNHLDALHVHNALDESDEAGSDQYDTASESDSQLLNIRHHRLPHIDSIHSSIYDLSPDILSQHSSRTIDNSEALSTHSSRTHGDGSLTPNMESAKEGPHTPESSGKSRGSRLMNKERVQSWVESCIFREESTGVNHSDSPTELDVEPTVNHH